MSLGRFFRELRRAALIALGAGVLSAGAMLGIGWYLNSLQSSAAEVRGVLRIVDGDSIVLDGQPVRIKGIDAPEARQTCRRGEEDWACGRAATEHLRGLLDGQTVVCRKSGMDRNQRILGICRAGRVQDVGARMVRDGFAVSFDATYLQEENDARRERRGVWASEFQTPRDFRRRNPRASVE